MSTAPKKAVSNYRRQGKGQFGKTPKTVPQPTEIAKLALEKVSSLLGTGIGAGVGAVMAPGGRRMEGAARGGARGSTTLEGAGMGALSGAATGAGAGLLASPAIAALVEKLTGRPASMHDISELSGLIGAGVGGLTGLGIGAHRGYHELDEDLGPASWQMKQADPVSVATMLTDGAITGGLAGHARRRSLEAQGKDPSLDPDVQSSLLQGFAMPAGMLGGIGAGSLAGIGLGLGASHLGMSDPTAVGTGLLAGGLVAPRAARFIIDKMRAHGRGTGQMVVDQYQRNRDQQQKAAADGSPKDWESGFQGPPDSEFPGATDLRSGKTLGLQDRHQLHGGAGSLWQSMAQHKGVLAPSMSSMTAPSQSISPAPSSKPTNFEILTQRVGQSIPPRPNLPPTNSGSVLAGNH